MTTQGRSRSGYTAWRLIAEELRREIVDGKRTPGAKLPTEGELAERFGVHNDRGLLLPFMVSHAMLGAMVGASRQHVTMQLVEFEREKAVTRENRRLVVIPEKLREAMK